MKVRALIRFNDYKESKIRNIGDIFEVSEERYQEILEKGGPWVELVEEETNEEDLTKLTRAELEELAKEEGIDEKDIKAAKNKDKLIELIEQGRA